VTEARADPASFLSGDAGDVTDPWRRAKRRLGELAYGTLDALAGTRRRAARLARTAPGRELLVIGVDRPTSHSASTRWPRSSRAGSSRT
jgi:hypothetical protein